MKHKCRVLALETATQFAGVAVVDDAHAPVRCYHVGYRVKGEKIMVFIDRALKDVNLKLKDIDLLAVGIGPGLYTGIRIGLSIMKGLSMAAQKPLVGISTMDTIACNFLGYKEKIVTLLNAYGGEAYGALYHVGYRDEAGGAVRRCGSYYVGPIENFLKKINPAKNKSSNRVQDKVIFTGAGVEIYKKKIEDTLGKRAIFSSKKLWIPYPSSLARLAVERFKKGSLPPPDKILPLYLKKSEAERKWKKR